MGTNQPLIDRLRRVATMIDNWNREINPPYTDWSALMDQAADAIEALEADDDETDETGYNEGANHRRVMGWPS
jgi:hypothetical protein